MRTLHVMHAPGGCDEMARRVSAGLEPEEELGDLG